MTIFFIPNASLNYIKTLIRFSNNTYFPVNFNIFMINISIIHMISYIFQ